MRQIKTVHTLRKAQDEKASAMTTDTSELLIHELLIQLIERFDIYLDQFVYEQYSLLRTQAFSVGIEEELIYRNTHPFPVVVQIYNLDSTQICFVGGPGVNTGSGTPVFTEGSERFMIPPGEEAYAIVSGGTIDLRMKVIQTGKLYE